MHRDRQFHPKEAVRQKNQAGDDHMNFPPPSSFPSVLPYASGNMMPIHGVELQPSEVCPKNFIIFDQTDYRSQIMFHPAIAHKFPGSGLHIGTRYLEENYERQNADLTERDATFINEDSDDIDALLSLEEDEQEEYDEEEVSTARTCGNYGSNSLDSCSFYGSKLKRNDSSSSSPENCVGSSSNCNSQRKHQKMKKMVKALRGIVPGGKEMNTVTVIDEAVKYLKSLKVEAQKLGVKNFKN